MQPLDLSQPITQERFGLLVGVTQQAVSDMVARGTLKPDGSTHAWLLAYTANLREQAAGRATTGDLELATERARLAKEQADRIAMQNAVQRRELAPVGMLESALASVSRQIAGALEAIPIHLKRQNPDVASEVLELVTNEIARARNIAAAIQLDQPANEDAAGDQPGDSPRLEAA
jgi:phage terminase Nu1 subunit (DNA packaging protein)